MLKEYVFPAKEEGNYKHCFIVYRKTLFVDRIAWGADNLHKEYDTKDKPNRGSSTPKIYSRSGTFCRPMSSVI